MNTENEGVLYVIGNGFDLNLELKTSYKYFFDNIIGWCSSFVKDKF